MENQEKEPIKKGDWVRPIDDESATPDEVFLVDYENGIVHYWVDKATSKRGTYYLNAVVKVDPPKQYVTSIDFG